MPDYVTYYEIHNRTEIEALPVEYNSGLNMVEVGRPDEADVIVYHVITDAETAGLQMALCGECMLTADAVRLAYPSLAGTTTVETEDGPAEEPRLKMHGWC